MVKLESLFSWFNNSDQVDMALIIVGVGGAIIEAGVAVAAVINVHTELEEHKKKKLEQYLEVFACIAAFLFLAEAILGCRSSMLLGETIETLKAGNSSLVAQAQQFRLRADVLEQQMRPRTINEKQTKDFISLTERIPKIPICIREGQQGFDTETFALRMREMLTAAGFGAKEGDANAIKHDQTVIVAMRHGITAHWVDAAILVPTNYFTDVITKVPFPVDPTGKPIAMTTNEAEVFNALVYVFEKVGITVSIETASGFNNVDGFEIFIPIKGQL